MIITEKKFCIFCLAWFCWHWGLLLFGFVPQPLRKTLMTGALTLDALCFITFIYLIIFRFEEIRANRWTSWRTAR